MFSLVREGQKVWPFCNECGCRLSVSITENEDEARLCHFGWLFETDARGCKCSLVNKYHYVSTKSVSMYEPFNFFGHIFK